MQQLQPFRCHFHIKVGRTCKVPARPAEAVDKSGPNRVATDREDEG
jgi:hypothetical protein